MIKYMILDYFSPSPCAFTFQPQTPVLLMAGRARALTSASSTTTRRSPAPVPTSWSCRRTNTPATVKVLLFLTFNNLGIERMHASAFALTAGSYFCVVGAARHINKHIHESKTPFVNWIAHLCWCLRDCVFCSVEPKRRRSVIWVCRDQCFVFCSMACSLCCTESRSLFNILQCGSGVLLHWIRKTA